MFKNGFEIACIYTATILGAGFISGKELLSFFVRYGTYGILGLVTAGILFGLVMYAVMQICHKRDIESYSEFSSLVFGKKLGCVMEYIVILFLMTLFCTMLSGGGEAVCKCFALDKKIGVYVIAIVCFVIFLFNLRGLVNINTLLCPVLVLGGIFIGLYIFINEAVFTSAPLLNGKFINNWVTSSVLYVAYNVITAISILICIRKLADKQQDFLYGSVISSIMLILLGIFMSLPLFLKFLQIKDSSLPILTIIENHSDTIRYIYLFVFTLAILTTAIGNGFAIIEWAFCKFGIKRFYLNCIVVIIGICFSRVQFSYFVDVIYPLFGYIGLFQMLTIFYFFIIKNVRSL